MAASGKTIKYEFPFPLADDVVDVSGDIRLLALKLEDDIEEIVEDIVGLMVETNTETGIDVSYNDSTGKLNFVLNTNFLKDEVSPMVAHDDHIGMTAVYDAISKKVTFEVVGGGGGGGGTSNASLSDMWWLGI